MYEKYIAGVAELSKAIVRKQAHTWSHKKNFMIVIQTSIPLSWKKDFSCTFKCLVPPQGGSFVPLKLTLKVQTNENHMVTEQGCRMDVTELTVISLPTLSATWLQHADEHYHTKDSQCLKAY